MDDFQEYVKAKAALDEYLEAKGIRTFQLQDEYMNQAIVRAFQAVLTQADESTRGTLYRVLSAEIQNLLSELKTGDANSKK